MAFIANPVNLVEINGFNLLDNSWAIPYYPSIK
jgi:hypothetical protein